MTGKSRGEITSTGIFIYQVLPLKMTLPADNLEVIKYLVLIVVGAIGLVLTMALLSLIFGNAWRDLKEWWEQRR